MRSMCTVGRLVYTLFEGEAVWGVTSLAGKIYLKTHNHLEVYDVNTYRLQSRFNVMNALGYSDMTSCEHYRCVYIGDDIDECVHRLDAQGAATRWAVNDIPLGLSVSAVHNVIVACPDVRKIKEFSTHGDLLRELTLPNNVISPRHAIQTRSGQFIVCHGYHGEPIHRVCMMSADGRHIIHSHGGQPFSDTGRYSLPVHLAVDDNEFVFVVDVNNRRVTLLSPTLEYVGQVVSFDQLMGWPRRLHFDKQRRLLYVADNLETAGCVAVFSV